MILEQETFDEYGYYPHELAPQSHKPILAICDDCGKPRATSKHNYRLLCPSCSTRKANNPNWKGGLVTFRCAYCGKEKKIPPSWIRKGAGKYCSHSCKGKAQEGVSTGQYVTEETRKKLREARRHQKIHHTKPELIFEEICKKYELPFKYTGDGAFWIKNINPDFVECNGKKITVEIFGVAFHSPLFTFMRNVSYPQTFEGRRRILKKYGWKLIVLWDRDLLRADAEQFVLSELKKHKAL